MQRARTMRRVWKNDPKRRQRQSAFFLKLWQRPAYRRKVVKAQTGLRRSDTTKRRLSIAMKAVWRRPSYRRRVVGIITERWRDPLVRRRHSESIQRLWHTSAYRDKQLKGQRAIWSDPKHRRKMAALVKRRWRDPAFRERMLSIARRNIGPSQGSQRLHHALGDGWVLEFWTPHGPVDIANPQARIAIEVDGADHDRPKQQRRDRQKERNLRRLGWTVLRVSEADCRGLHKKGVSK